MIRTAGTPSPTNEGDPSAAISLFCFAILCGINSKLVGFVLHEHAADYTSPHFISTHQRMYLVYSQCVERPLSDLSLHPKRSGLKRYKLLFRVLLLCERKLLFVKPLSYQSVEERYISRWAGDLDENKLKLHRRYNVLVRNLARDVRVFNIL